ncbi:hypothetical protein PRIPAC_91195 [Pristionchus pacificus]|uniref:Uncharacterized protein n=1 Tax=Pristionchus pacificus TaxID=54126 RepID=A0A2A6CWV8_PRIPA|nr:hypothetical protein PRIPAC_91195 [Pristionchus pacificus]|eukprot:PDM82628.1 hypothetical protein PRIPAC_37021 [Pristionchus pacificus]
MGSKQAVSSCAGVMSRRATLFNADILDCKIIMHSSLLLVLLITVAVNAQTWTGWVDTVNPPCSATCGMCGVKVVATRTCSQLGKCSGAAQRYEECGSKMCPFKGGKPGKTCCSGYTKGLLPNGQGFECVARKAEMDRKTNLSLLYLFQILVVMHSSLILIPLIVVTVAAQQWTTWTPTPNSACSATCGMCGVQVIATRTCPVLGKCSGPSQQYGECGAALCPFPTPTCCTGYVKGNIAGGGFECVPRKEIMDAKTKLT